MHGPVPGGRSDACSVLDEISLYSAQVFLWYGQELVQKSVLFVNFFLGQCLWCAELSKLWPVKGCEHTTPDGAAVRAILCHGAPCSELLWYISFGYGHTTTGGTIARAAPSLEPFTEPFPVRRTPGGDAPCAPSFMIPGFGQIGMTKPRVVILFQQHRRRVPKAHKVCP